MILYLNELNLIKVLPNKQTNRILLKIYIYILKQTGNCETLFPSILNSSSFEQLAKEGGMAERRLYLINSRLRFLRLPINSGKSTNSL
jgi:hypothetical protein